MAFFKTASKFYFLNNIKQHIKFHLLSVMAGIIPQGSNNYSTAQQIKLYL